MPTWSADALIDFEESGRTSQSKFLRFHNFVSDTIMRLMNYAIRISRSDGNGRRNFKSFALEAPPEMTVLDALFSIQQQQDPTIAFRCSCRVGMCGSCAIQVNGVARLACKTRLCVLEAKEITLASLPHFPVIRDLVVALDPFFEHWRKVLPAFHPRDPGSAELARIPAGSPYARLTTGKRDCITCGACFAACSVPGMNKKYLGPAAINKALLRILHPNDTAREARLRTVNETHSGIWRCHTQFNCGAVCPKGINLTDSIALLKRGLPRQGEGLEA
jgi:succinate dehydrogenase / fumarate reductase, iron-sulfur subunit